jgi:aldehyde:ferredoxin oxidoreductase
MGSKNLKAIVIKTEGLKAKNIENPEFNELAELYKSTIKNSSGCKYRASTGTLNIMTAFNVCEDIWERNYQEFVPEQKAKKLEPENFLENYYTERKSGCWNCSMACSLHWEIKEGEYTGLKGEKIEFGHTFPLGVNLGCFNFDEVLYLADLSNKLGLDSMELGFSLGFLTECVQRNIVKEEDVGLKVEWGNSRVYGELIKMIADRKGIGEILSHGVRQASMAFGEESRKFAFHYKGQAYRMESNRSWELSFAVSPRGGDHLKAMPFTTFAFGTPHSMDYMLGKSQMDFYDMQSEIGKGRYTWWHENYKTIVDCLGICIFPLINLFLNGEAQPADLLKVYNTCTGSNLSLDEFWLSAERVYQIMRLFNTFQGIDRKDDILPDRKTDDEEKCFPINSININASGMLDEYYTYRGYSSQGLPTYKRLKEVGLEEIIPRLEKADLIRNDDVPEALELFYKK